MPVPRVGTIGTRENLQNLFYAVDSHLQSLDNGAHGLRHKDQDTRPKAFQLERWNVGSEAIKKCPSVVLFSHYSNLPSFQYSFPDS